MADMNLRDYAETTKIAAMVGGGGLLAYFVWKSGFFQAIGGIASGVKDLVVAVINPDDEPISKELAEKLQTGSVGLGSSNLFFLNPELMTPFFNTALLADQVGIKATSSYVVIRARDFDGQWRIKDTAYKAAVGMHKDNKTILERHVLITGGMLKTAFRQLVKTADFVIIYPDGSFKSA